MIFQLTYASTAAKPFSADELLAWLPSFREKNMRLNVTGLLLYRQGSFMQALEGEEATVRALFQTIRDDARHHHVLTLATVPLAERQFLNWSMGFETLDDANIGAVPGYVPPLNLPAVRDDLPWQAAAALNLLSSFMHQP